MCVCGGGRVAWFVASVGCLEQHAPDDHRFFNVVVVVVGRLSVFLVWPAVCGLSLVVLSVVLFENCIVDASIFFIVCDFVSHLD